MYSPNEYYKPYNPSSRTRDRYRERQRVPPQYVSSDKNEKPLASFRILDHDTPPPPHPHNSITNYSSLNTMGLYSKFNSETDMKHHKSFPLELSEVHWPQN